MVATSGVRARSSSLTTRAWVPSRNASLIDECGPAAMVRECGPSRRALSPPEGSVSLQSPPTVTSSRVEPGTGFHGSGSLVGRRTIGWSLLPVADGDVVGTDEPSEPGVRGEDEPLPGDPEAGPLTGIARAAAAAPEGEGGGGQQRDAAGRAQETS